MKKITLFLISFFFFLQATDAQIAQVLPQNPQWNTALQISYNRAHENAFLKGHEDIFAVLDVFYQDGDKRRFVIKLEDSNGLYANTFVVPQGASFFSVTFQTLTKEDEKNVQQLKVYENSIPVKNAFIDELPYFSELADSLFQLEMKHYPKNYAAYGIYFGKLIPAPYSDARQKALDKYMPELEKLYQKKKNQQDLHLIFSLCVGYSRRKNLEEAQKYFEKLLQLYPASPYTLRAFSIMEYESYSVGNMPSINEGLQKTIANACKNSPASPVCAENIKYIKKDSTVDLNTLEKILHFAIEKDSLVVAKKRELAQIYLEKQLYDKAEQQIEKTIQFLLHSGYNYNWIAENEFSQEELARAYHILSDIKMAQAKPVEALAAINSSINLITGTDAESYYLNNFLLARAAIYQNQNHLNLAEEDYTILYIKDDTSAVHKLLDIYLIKNNDTTGFSKYLQRLENKYIHKVELKIAPEFSVTDMNGITYSTSQLKGKIVVLNFWGVGCAPCIVEIPELNRLTEVYANNSDVVFLAITNQDMETLNTFFVKHPFKYKIVNNAPGLSRKFNVSGIPHHFIINQHGQIIKHVFGAKPDIADMLSRKINQALQSSK